MLIAGKYKVLAELGVGAFGIVYRAQDTVLDRAVALKTIRADVLATVAAREEFERRFLREARASAKLNHPHIVAVYDAGTHDGRPYLAMEMVEGATLRKALAARRTIPVSEATALAGQLLSALAYAHGAGVVHRDIKPENLMLRTDGVLKVTDFGIAKLMLADETSLTREGSTLGTPHYMAPEQILSNPVDGRADLYAAAAILYEMVVGRRPFTADSIPALLHKVLHEPPKVPRGDVPVWLADVLIRGLAKDPAARFGRAEELLAVLERQRMEPSVEPTRRLDEEPRAPGPVTTALAREPTPASDEWFAPWTPPAIAALPDDLGTIEATPVADVLFLARRRQDSGLLVLRGTTVKMGIALVEGMAAGAFGGPPATYLGSLLKARGALDDASAARLDGELRAQRRAGTCPRVGEAAVRLGVVRPQHVIEALEAQVRARVEVALGLEEGRYAFYRGYTLPGVEPLGPWPLESQITAWLRGSASGSARSVGSSMRRLQGLVASVDAKARDMLPSFRFGSHVQRLLRELQGSVVSDAMARVPLPRPEAELAVHVLGSLGLITFSAPREADTVVEPAVAAPAAPPPAAAVPPAGRAGALPAETIGAPTRAMAPEPVAPARSEAAVMTEVAELLARAERAMEAKDFAAARRVLGEALRVDPANPRALAGLGWATFRTQPALESVRAEAKRLLGEALAASPRLIPAKVSLARILRMEDDLAGAKQLLEAAVAIDPFHEEARRELHALDELAWRRGGE